MRVSWPYQFLKTNELYEEIVNCTSRYFYTSHSVKPSKRIVSCQLCIKNLRWTQARDARVVCLGSRKFFGKAPKMPPSPLGPGLGGLQAKTACLISTTSIIQCFYDFCLSQVTNWQKKKKNNQASARLLRDVFKSNGTGFINVLFYLTSKFYNMSPSK